MLKWVSYPAHSTAQKPAQRQKASAEDQRAKKISCNAKKKLLEETSQIPVQACYHMQNLVIYYCYFCVCMYYVQVKVGVTVQKGLFVFAEWMHL